jgi:N,N'-diacetyllegionaminate synthase
MADHHTTGGAGWLPLRTGTWPERCLVIGEVAQTHDGSLGTAHAYVDAIADAGADAVKFQTHLAAAESTPSEPWRVRFSPQDDTRYDYWLRMEFTEPQWAGLAEHAAERGLLFLSSPFSLEAVELLERVGMPAWKIASGEVGNRAMLERTAATGAPLILSSGMSGYEELDRAVALLRELDARFAVLQCATAYPTTPEQVGLNVLAELRERYDCPVGLSDHSATIYPGIAAVTLGARVVEVHATVSRRAFGPDVVASLTIEELAALCDGVRAVERMLDAPVDKDASAADMGALRAMFTKSVVVRRPLAAGDVLTLDALTAKKPGTGIPSDRIPELVGRRVRRPVATDALLADDDLEPLP